MNILSIIVLSITNTGVIIGTILVYAYKSKLKRFRTEIDKQDLY